MLTDETIINVCICMYPLRADAAAINQQMKTDAFRAIQFHW